jgi:hypothetical protein
MKAKLFEVRDRLTFIPVLAVKLGPSTDQEDYLVRRCAHSYDRVLLTWVTMETTHYDSNQWEGSRTLREAHRFIQVNFEVLEPGAVVDVEYILGETEEPKQSEAITV